MLYVQDILMPDEKILHHAKVHYILYAPGLFLFFAALLVAYIVPDLAVLLGSTADTQATVRRIAKLVAGACFLGGVGLLLRAWLDIYSTEVVVTNHRVLVKVGISTATTAEIEKNRISSVIVTKPMLGRILDYGWISILGYSGDITGLPVISRPHTLQRHIYGKNPATSKPKPEHV